MRAVPPFVLHRFFEDGDGAAAIGLRPERRGRGDGLEPRGQAGLTERSGARLLAARLAR